MIEFISISEKEIRGFLSITISLKENELDLNSETIKDLVDEFIMYNDNMYKIVCVEYVILPLKILSDTASLLLRKL